MKYFSLLCLSFLCRVTFGQAIPQPAIEEQVAFAKIDPRLFFYMDGKITVKWNFVNSQGNGEQIWRTYDCNDKKSWLLYTDNYRSGLAVKRVYGKNSFFRYAPPALENVPPPRVPILKKWITNICAAPVKAESEWMIVKHIPDTDKEQEISILVDIQNSQRVGDILTTRLAYDFEVIKYSPVNDAPCSYIVEDIQFNCQTQNFRIIADSAIDTQGFVSNHMLYGYRPLTTVEDPIRKDVLLHLCEVNNFPGYKGRGKPPARVKKVSSTMGPRLPDFGDNRSAPLEQYSLPLHVQRQVNTLFKYGALQPKFKRLTFTEHQPTSQTSIIIDVEKYGLTRTLYQHGSGFAFQKSDIANFLPLKAWNPFRPTPFVTQTLETDIHLPFKKGQHFTVKTQPQDAVTKEGNSTNSAHCQVGQQITAEKLHPKLPGRYWQIECVEHSHKLKATHNYAYLEALGIFILIGKTEAGKLQPYTISDLILSW